MQSIYITVETKERTPYSQTSKLIGWIIDRAIADGVNSKCVTKS